MYGQIVLKQNFPGQGIYSFLPHEDYIWATHMPYNHSINFLILLCFLPYILDAYPFSPFVEALSSEAEQLKNLPVVGIVLLERDKISKRQV